VRITVGDEMSKRAKFALITWIGANVSALKRAKVSTDKTVVKAVIMVYGAHVSLFVGYLCSFFHLFVSRPAIG